MRIALYGAAVVGVITIVWIAYTLVAPEAEDLLPHAIVQAGEPLDFPDALAAHLNAPISNGNRVELLENGEEIFPAMLGAIREAEHSVNFLTFVYWQGTVAQDFAEALSAASDRGVEVRVLLDAVGAHKMRDALVERMERSGVEVAWFHPLDWYSIRRLNNRTHRKVLVVDGRVGFTGGVGIAEEWSGDAEDSDHWRDNHFRVTGPAVHHLQGAFAENWLNATGSVLGGKDFFPRLDSVGSTRAIALITSPRGDMSPIAFTYWLALQAAGGGVDIATPYFLPDPALLEAVARTARRGVRVRLLVPGDHNDSRLVRWASLTLYRTLLDAGVELYEFRPTMMHAKLLIVDDRWTLIGSANFDNRSFELNDEISVFVDDEEFNRTLKASFERDLGRAERITESSFQRIPFWQRLLGVAAQVLREQL